MGGGDQFLAELLVGGMQTHRQGELGPPQPLQGPLRQLGQGVGHAYGAEGDLALGHTQIAAEAINCR